LNLPVGYEYSSAYAGLRKTPTDDLALIVSTQVASAAALFTQNLVQAAPVRLARKHLQASRGRVRAILINAGNANCATRTADRAALATVRAVARLGRWPVRHVLPCSTGVIGVELDPNLILAALPQLFERLSPARFADAAKAILTTDTVPKMASGEVPLRDGVVRIAGFTKGSGMIAPHLATTLGFVLTDAALTPTQLQPMLRRAADRSYNRLSVDGDTSTNDTLVLMANGASGVAPNEKERKVFEEVLCWVLEDLAEKIARDGEGARKCVTIHVTGTRHNEDAHKIARAIATSPLVKTALAGSDPNWGRILCAAGYSGARFLPEAVTIKLQGTVVCQRGQAAEFDEAAVKRALDAADIQIRFIAGKGPGECQFWTCDLTEGYIRINGSYRT